MPFLTMPSLTISLLKTGCFLGLAFLLECWTPVPNMMPENQAEPRIIATVDSYKNTTMLDTNQQMIALQGFLTPFYTDFRYASETNFTKEILYTEPAAYLRRPAAKALQIAINLLKDRNLTVKIYDAYRPYGVTKRMWKVVPDSRYTASPTTGSSHNRGTAIDLTLVDLATGAELEMPTAFDDFSGKAHHNYRRLKANVIANRRLLRSVMEQAGFVSLPTEWWHYSLPASSGTFELLDIDFAQMKEVATQYQPLK